MYRSKPIRNWLSIFVVALSVAAIVGTTTGCGDKKAEKESGKTEKKTDDKKGKAKDGKLAVGDKKKEKKKIVPGVPVSVVSVKRGEIYSTVTFSSTVESEREVTIYPQTSGLVRSILVEEGDRVFPGKALLVLDDADARLTERRAYVDFEKARGDSTRNAHLFKRRMISRDAYENSIYEAARNRLAWQQAQLTLSRTRIRTPVAGVISSRNVEIGDRIGSSSQPFKLVTMDNLVARVFVPGRSLPHLISGQRARISSDMLVDFEGGGYIKRISPVIDPKSGTVKVTVGLKNAEKRLTPGMFVNVALITEQKSDALLLPKETLVRDGGKSYAFVVRDSVASRKQITLGLQNSRTVQIAGGLNEGDMVIIVGQEGLRDGARVRIIADASKPIPKKPDKKETPDKITES